MDKEIINAFTVDVEEYFHARRFHACQSSWERLIPRLPHTLERMLAIVEKCGVKGTFFILGWVAQKYPSMIRQLAKDGHEVGSHGFYHENIQALSKDKFYQDISRTKAYLEDCIGQPVVGYRAPNFSLNKMTQWAWESLMKAGYQYSSSVNPIHHDHYGWPTGPKTITSISLSSSHQPSQHFLEIPISTLKKGRWTLPCGGGGYFRLLPYQYFTYAIQRLNHQKIPAIFYCHPWEMDAECPQSKSNRWIDKQLFHWNQRGLEKKLQHLLKTFRWGRVQDVLSGFR